jgi:hypothetical protein
VLNNAERAMVVRISLSDHTAARPLLLGAPPALRDLLAPAGGLPRDLDGAVVELELPALGAAILARV